MAEKKAVEVRAFRMVCPMCGKQLSISVLDQGMRPADWPANVLGVADCNCQKGYLVIMPPELENALIAHLTAASSHYYEAHHFIRIIRDALWSV